MYLFSGNCCLCECGDFTNSFDMYGDRIRVGDIVQLWHGNYIGTDIEEWFPSTGLTAVVRDEFRTVNHGYKIAIEKCNDLDSMIPFTMGIKSCGISDDEWNIKIVKSFSEIVDGERFKDYGFNFHEALPERYELLPPAGSP